MLRLLVTGSSNIIRRSNPDEVKDTARLLGINLDNCVFDGERGEKEVPPLKSVNKSKSDNREITSKNFKKEQKKGEEETLVAHDSDQSASYKCDVCNSVFRALKYLSSHRRKQHKIWKRKEDQSNSGKLKCELCGTVFKARMYYVRHRFRSHGLRTKKLTDVADEFSGNKCDVCGTVFKKRNYLLRHRFRQHGLRTRKFLKLKVNEKIKKENLIKVEVKDHLENYVSATELDESVGDATTFIDETCGFCGEMFENYDNLNQHKANCY